LSINSGKNIRYLLFAYYKSSIAEKTFGLANENWEAGGSSLTSHPFPPQAQ
jgi:hypothetical protein